MHGHPDISARVASTVAAFVGTSMAVTADWRGWRWVARLPGGMIAYAAVDDAGWEKLRREQLLLQRLTARMTVPLQEVCFSSESNWVQLRRMTAGKPGFWIEELVCGWPGYVPYSARLRSDFPLTVQGQRLACDLGKALAQLQCSLSKEEARELELSPVTYFDDLGEIEEALRSDGSLDDLLSVLPGLRSWARAEALDPDPVLIHGDLYASNLAVNDDGQLVGIFDFEWAAFGSRTDDLKYLPGFGLPFLERLLDSYQEHGAAAVTLNQVWNVHAFSALEHLTRVSPGTLRRSRVVEWCRVVAPLVGR